MSNLTLDGSTSFIGTEFIKLLATGSSNLATEEYVDDAIEQNGGGGNVDLSNYYSKTETDNLLNAKLNVNNPQDITGNLRLDPTNGLSKIILNAVGVPNDEDFYVNGNGFINGEMRASSMKCDNTLTFATIKGNFISNNDSNTDLKFQINSNDFITLSTANDVIEVDKDIEIHSSVLKSDVLDTWSNSSLEIRRNGVNYLSLESDDTISISRQTKIGSNKADGVDMTVSHYNNTTNLFEKKLSFKNGNEIHATGDGGVDEELLLNYYTDAGVRIGNATDAYLTIKGARNATHTLTVNGDTYFGGAVSYNGDIVLTNPYKLKTNEISSNGVLEDIVFKIDGITTEFFRCQASDFTVRLPNDRSFLSQNIFSDIIKPLGFSNDVVLNGGNSTNDAYEEYLRLDASTERVNFIKDIDTTENIYMNLNKRLYLNDTVGSERYIGSTFRSGTPSFNQLDIVNNNSSNGRIRLMINTEENVIVENSQLYSKRVITAVAGVKGNIYNSNGDNDVVFQRNDVPFMTLDKFTEDVNGTPTEIEAIICSKQLRANGNILVKNLQINQISVGVEYADFRLHNADSVMRFYVGNSTGVNLQITNNDIQLNRATSITSVKTNLINSNGDNDVVFQRNGSEFFRCEVYTDPDTTTYNLINVNTGTRISAHHVYVGNIVNRANGYDTVYTGSNAAGDGRVDYMRWNYLGQSVDFDAPIDNTGLAITGNIIDTTVSDERLKTNIEDVDTDFTSCIKNVKVKTFKYKDDKYKTNDNYGFIAQELKEHLPKECKNIVKENKDKTSDDKFLSINYMKLSVVLWKALQEEIDKREHIESRLFALEDIVKEMRGKKTTKPKAKAKSKTKAEK